MSEWSIKEDIKLSLLYFRNESDIHSKLGKTFKDVNRRIYDLSLNSITTGGCKHWTRLEDDIVRIVYRHLGWRSVQMLLPWRTKVSIQTRVMVLKLSRKVATLEEDELIEWFSDKFDEN